MEKPILARYEHICEKLDLATKILQLNDLTEGLIQANNQAGFSLLKHSDKDISEKIKEIKYLYWNGDKPADIQKSLSEKSYNELQDLAEKIYDLHSLVQHRYNKACSKLGLIN